MTFTLSAVVLPAFTQTLGAVAGLIAKAEAHCADTGTAPAELIDARLAPDMLSFAWQVKFVAGHSHGALDAVPRGTFSPERTPPPADFAGLRALVSDAEAEVAAADAGAIDELVGRDMMLVVGDMRLPFTAEDYLFSFALPNLHFHAATAYNILRHKGVALNKRDFLGAVRIKR